VNILAETSPIFWLIQSSLVGGWPIPLKNDGVGKCWDDDIPNCFWKVIKFHGSKAFQTTNHQPDEVLNIIECYNELYSYITVCYYNRMSIYNNISMMIVGCDNPNIYNNIIIISSKK
jgi:hypothetical protein